MHLIMSETIIMRFGGFLMRIRLGGKRKRWLLIAILTATFAHYEALLYEIVV